MVELLNLMFGSMELVKKFEVKVETLDESAKSTFIVNIKLDVEKPGQKTSDIDTLKENLDKITKEQLVTREEVKVIREKIVDMNDQLIAKLREIDAREEKYKIISDGIKAYEVFTKALKEF